MKVTVKLESGFSWENKPLAILAHLRRETNEGPTRHVEIAFAFQAFDTPASHIRRLYARSYTLHN